MADAERADAPRAGETVGAPRAKRSGAGPLRLVGPALAVLAVGLAALVHHGLGPPPEGDAAWYHPRGFLRGPLAALGLTAPVPTALAAAAAPAALGAAVLLTTRSALARTAALAAVFAAALYGYYGRRLTLVWELYQEHWSATLALFALAAAGALGAVGLARSWRRLPSFGRAATYLPVFAFVLAFERNVTGTDPALRFSLSPWPLVQIFALEAFATGVATLLLGVGTGLLAARVLGPRLGGAAAAAGGGLLAAAVPVGSLALGPRLGLLAFEAPPPLLALVGVVALVVAALALLLSLRASAPGAGDAPGSRSPAERVGARGRLFTTAALLLGAPLLIGQVLTKLDYAETRDVRARRIIEALEAYQAEHGSYPGELAELVQTGHLERIPEPRIGFPGLPQPGFRYDGFGTSYMLEFAAPRWVQCAYNPPWQDDLAEEEPPPAPPAEPERSGSELAETELAGSWSCPSTPPELW